jgi:hypothetical protein
METQTEGRGEVEVEEEEDESAVWRHAPRVVRRSCAVFIFKPHHPTISYH